MSSRDFSIGFLKKPHESFDQNGQYLLVVSLTCYKWYQSQVMRLRGRCSRRVLQNNPNKTLLEQDTVQCASEDDGPPNGWIVRSHVSWRDERNILYKGVETSP